MRAAIMGMIGLLAIRAGRLYSARNAIVISALVMLIITPAAVKDIGFELSFLALIGIVYLMPALENFCRVERWESFLGRFGQSRRFNWLNWRENLFMTLAAQIMVAPLILYYFKSLSGLGLAANILILAMVPYAMLGSFLAGGAGLVAEEIGRIFGEGVGIIGEAAAKGVAITAEGMLAYIIFIIKFTAQNLKAMITAEQFSLIFMLVYYLILGGFIYWWFNRSTH